MKDKVKKAAAGWSIIVMAAYPALFLYGKNYTDVSFKEILYPINILVFSYICVFFLALFMIKDYERAVLYTLFIIIWGNFFHFFLRGLQFFIPSTKYWHILSLFIMLSCILINITKNKLSKEVVKIGIALLITLANAYLIVNLLPPVVSAVTNHSRKVPARSNLKGTPTDLPNIYYLVFDEYSSNDFMKKYYNYDNQDLVDKLNLLGFNISLSSTNEAYMTNICMTNSLNLNYLFDMDDDKDNNMAEEIIKRRENNLLFEILKDQNYNISAVGQASFYGLKDASNAGEVEAATFDGKSFRQLVLQQTFFYPYIKNNPSKKMKNIDQNRAYIKNANFFPNSGEFVLFHIEMPHTPFVVDQNGTLISSENILNWNDKKYYLGQYKYATDMMIDIVSDLVKEDENAVIVLTSDHSARALDEFDEVDKCQIFNAVYFQGKKLDIEGLSGINTLRLILNELFNMDFDMIKTIPLSPAGEN